MLFIVPSLTTTSTALPVAFDGMCGHGDDGRTFRVAEIAADLAHRLNAIQFRHVDIHQDHIRRLFCTQSQCLSTIRCFTHQLEVGFSGGDLEIGFNVTYLLDALAAIDVDGIEIEYETAGNKSDPALLLVMGLGAWRLAREVVATLAKQTCESHPQEEPHANYQ